MIVLIVSQETKRTIFYKKSPNWRFFGIIKLMKRSVKVGFVFGLTSGIITTLGLIVGLYSGTHSKFVIIGGILTIAIADAFSDALGIHISEESETNHSVKEVWQATFSTFLSKFIFALTFVVPVLLFQLKTAVIVSMVWGLLLLAVLSFSLGRKRKANPWKLVIEHLFIALLVVVITRYVAIWIATFFV